MDGGQFEGSIAMVTHVQTYPNSCGAASLLCAASELGVATIPANATYPRWTGGPKPLAVTTACETDLYQVTGSATGAPSPQDWGYSMPSGVVSCARLLGLNAWALAYDTWTVKGLKFAYNDEIARLRGLNALAESSDTHSTTKPVGHQRELKILFGRERSNFGALHYVMVRPDGTVMEPGFGNDHASIDACKTAVSMHGTGLSVMVQV